MKEFWSFIVDVMRDAWNTKIVRAITVILIVSGVLVLLWIALPVIASIYLLLFLSSWNASVAQLFNLPLMNLGQASALCLTSVLLLVPLLVLVGLVRIVTK